MIIRPSTSLRIQIACHMCQQLFSYISISYTDYAIKRNLTSFQNPFRIFYSGNTTTTTTTCKIALQVESVFIVHHNSLAVCVPSGLFAFIFAVCRWPPNRLNTYKTEALSFRYGSSRRYGFDVPVYKVTQIRNKNQKRCFV